MTDTLRTVFEAVLRHPMPELTPATAFAHLPGWDSVAHLALLLAVEHQFNVAFTSAQMVNMKTVGDLMAAIGGTHG